MNGIDEAMNRFNTKKEKKPKEVEIVEQGDVINIAGASDGRAAVLIADILKERKGQSLIVVPSLTRARRMQVDLCFFSGMTEEEIYIMPPDDNSLVQFETKSDDYLPMRMKALKAVSNDKRCIIIAPVTSAVKKLPPKEMYTERLITLNRGEEIDIEEVRRELSLLAYERSHDRGQG